MRNSRSFSTVCGGNYGRKVLYTSAEKITRQNVATELANVISQHWRNREEIDYLDRYYRGDQPILFKNKPVRPKINNKIVENHALEVVRFMTSQKYGEPMQYVSRETDERTSEMVDKLNKYMLDRNKAYWDLELGEWQSIAGTSYRYLWSDKNADIEAGEPPFDLEVADPRDTAVVYFTRRGRPAAFSIQIVKDEERRTKYCIYTDAEYFEVQDGKVICAQKNGLGMIPVIEYPNNTRRLSDMEIVITMFDAINSMQSDRLDGIDQFVQAFMKFVNCEINKDQFLEMCELGAIQVKSPQGVQADVSLVSSELDQNNTQIAKDDLYKNMLIILGMPNREQNTGGDTGQAVYLRNGWDFAEQRAKLDEPVIIRAEKEFLKRVLYIFRIKEKYKIDLKLSDFDVKITRNKTDNMVVKTQGLLNQLNGGIHPQIAIETCGLYSDPEKVYLNSREYLDAKYKKAGDEITEPIQETKADDGNTDGGGDDHD